MLNGIDPIIIFNFKKNFLDPTADSSKIPLPAGDVSSFPLPAIPIYLSERLTGIYIDSEEKSIDIETNTTPTSDGAGEKSDQRVMSSTVSITMKAKRDSIGVSLFSAMSDLIIPKITSKEYSITYIHGAVIVFAGLLHSFSISQVADTDLYTIQMSLVKPGGATVTSKTQPLVANDPQAAQLNDAFSSVGRA